MKRSITAMILVAVLATPALADFRRQQPTVKYSMLNCVEESDVVAVGRVELLTGVYRKNLIRTGQHLITTDVLIRVETLIKGETNSGPRHIKMMILGGTAYIPEDDEVISLSVTPQPKFKAGERVMLFIKNNTEDKWFRNYPHGRYRLYLFDYGKRLVKDDQVDFRYTNNVKMPIELAINLSKAYLEDKAAALLLENDIKTASRTTRELPSETATRLNNLAEALIPAEEDE